MFWLRVCPQTREAWEEQVIHLYHDMEDMRYMRSKISGLRSSTDSVSCGALGVAVVCDVPRDGEGNELWESGKVVPEESVVDCNVSPWASESPSSSSKLQYEMCRETTPSPNGKSNQAEKTMYKCHGPACKTKNQGCPQVDLLHVVPTEDGVGYTRFLGSSCWTAHKGGVGSTSTFQWEEG